MLERNRMIVTALAGAMLAAQMTAAAQVAPTVGPKVQPGEIRIPKPQPGEITAPAEPKEQPRDVQPAPLPPAPPPAEVDSTGTVIRTTVNVVVAPVTVLDSDGKYVNGLEPHQFRLFDNQKDQNIKVDVAYQPISLVIAVQANDRSDYALQQVQKIGAMIQPLITGEQGEVAVIAFDHRVRELTPFTTDADKITQAMKKVTAGSTSAAINDAVMHGVRMLKTRPQNRRRVMLLISETRDRGSQGRARDTILEAQLANVSIYTVNMSRFVSTIIGQSQPPRPDPLPPAMRPMPGNTPATPTTVAQKWGGPGGQMQFLPLMIEIFRDVKAIFVDNPVELYTKGTGGREYSFVKQRGLEEAITAIGEELHSQYLISYNPNNKGEGGFHDINVVVADRRADKVITRPGYWMAAKFE